MASFALVMALGALGRGDELTAVADRALDRASTSFQTAHLRFWFGGVYARACRLTGRIDDCAKVAKQMADSVNDVPGLAYANLVFLLGQSDLMRGELPGAVKLLHEALAGVEHHGITTGLRPATCFALAEAHAKLGQSAEANAALEEARAERAGHLRVHAHRPRDRDRMGAGGRRVPVRRGDDRSRSRRCGHATAVSRPMS